MALRVRHREELPVGWSNRSFNRSVYVLALGSALSALTSPAHTAAPASAAFETATVTLSPQDTFLTLDNDNYSANPRLKASTWPDYQVADAIVMKFDFSALPAGAVIQKAELNLALVQSDGAAAAYTMTAHKLLGKNAIIGAATGYTADGTTSWTANGCCSGGIPMAQADISTAYDSAAIDQAAGFKSWDVTTMAQEWMLAPATNFGLLLNADITALRDRYRSFASVEHEDSSLRPFLRVTYTAVDVAPPSVAISAPGSGDVLTGTAALEASASDDVAVAAVRFEIDGTPVGPELTSVPYRLNWDTTTVSDGTYTLTAVARDSTGNSAPSAGVSVTIENGILILTPEDTVVTLDAVNYGTSTNLTTYTWPNDRAASAILMKFDFAALPAGAVVQEAKLHLNLVASDASVDAAYVVAAHKIVGKNAVLAAATGYTADGTTPWTPNACCQNGVPLAQADISAAYDSPAIDKAAGFKTWNLTTLIQEWVLHPSTNAGLLLNADASKPGDRYRIFASTEHADATIHPFLRIRYSPGADVIVSARDASATSDGAISEIINPLLEAALAPVATVPVSPSGSIATATPAFTWSAVATATYYLLSIADADPGSPLETWFTPSQAGCPIGVGTCTVAAPRTLKPGLVTWKVLTYNLDGYGPWSAPMTAVVQAVDGALQPPATIGPTGAITTPTPIYSWNPMSGIVWYQVSVTDALGISSDFWYTPAQACASSPCAVTPNTLLAIGPAQWRMRAWSAVGASAWTALVSFDVSTAVPGQATLIAPAGAIASQTPTFTWNARLGVSYYLLKVTDVDNFSVERWYRPSEVGCPLGTGICSVSPGIPVTPGPAEWQILTWNAFGYGAWTDPRPFTVEIPDLAIAGASGRPTPISPTGSITTNHPTYRWSAHNNATRYRLSIRINGGAATYLWYTRAAAACNAVDCLVHPNITLQNGTADWQVQMWTTNGHGTWSAVVPLSVNIAAPQAPDLVSPTGVTTSLPSFVWEPSTNAAYYYVRVSDATGLRIDKWLKPEEVGCFSGTANCTLNAAVTLSNGAGSWEALAWNETGYSPWSPALGFVVSSDAVPPAVAISTPAAGSTLSGTTTVSASASDNIGVAGVQFKLDGVNLGVEDTTSPYSVSWNTATATNGSHTLTAVARDAAGNTTPSAAVVVTVTNDTTAPAVSISAPAGGATVSGTLNVTASASDNVGVVGVQFKLDGVNLGTEDTTSPYSRSWNSTTATNGSHTLTAVARDAAGNTTTSAVVTVAVSNDTTDPTVSISAPAGGATVSGTLNVSATASDNVGVVGVQFKLDGVNLGAEDTTSPYSTSWNTTTASNGSHTLTAVARDAAGNTTTSAVVTVAVSNDTTDPTVAISAPAGGATVSGTLNVTATASDNIGVVGVQFKLDGVNLGAEDTTSPYSVSWNTTTAVNGSHSLTAVARDAAGNTTTSTAVTVTVSNDSTLPAVSISAPAGGATVSGTITVSATASDNVGVGGVQFKLDGVNLGAEDTTSPYSVSWNTATATNGAHTLTAVARDAAGNTRTSTAVGVTVANAAVLLLSPQDTSINLNTTNYSADTTLTTYTWPNQRVANAILMKFNLASLPAGALVQDATLQLALVESDATADATYSISVHKIVARNPTLTTATGYTIDGVTSWTANACCNNNVPMAQADISAAHDTQAINKTLGLKSWDVATIVQEWLADPSSNFGLLLNSDATKLADRYRYFASMEHADPALRPVLRITYAMPAPDPTPPSVSMTAPAAGATVSGTVTVSATASDNVGVANVQFQLDGVNLGAPDAAAPYSLSWNTTTTTNGSHTLRAIARDAAGNTTTSASVTVTVANDVTAPTVSVSAPAGGATLSGTVNVSASASDNVGVAGVQFTLNGANLGTEDTTSPYSVSWNTTTASNGSHTLRAVARDANGNTTTSAAVVITVSNSGPPPVGIAALYPGDVGIENHPDVILAERFEDALSSVLGRWTDVLNGTAMSLASDVPAGSTGTKSLTIPWVGGGVNDGGHLYKQLATPIDDVLYVRYYIKYPTSGTYDHTGIWMGGNNPASSWPNPQAGVKPAGNDRFIAAAEQNNEFGRFDHYNYWMNMRQSGDGQYWGNLLLNNPNVKATEGQWVCVEHMVKLNDPASSNGEHAIWLNGVKVSHLGQGFPNGSWSGGIFTQSTSGTPFEGFRWRNTSALKLNWLWLQVYAPDDPSGVSANIKFDHVVAATNYIGCLTSGGGGGDAIAPTTSLSAPAGGATLSGNATVSATASDNVGVVGVQFKLDGVNLGAEDTTSPYSITWDTTTASNGSHTLTAVARDAAGNSTTSAGRSVTVSNGGGGGSPIFESNWDTATGTSSNAVTDGGRWPNYWEFNNGSSVQLMSVVSGGVNGHNALRVQQRGSSFAANVQIDNVVPQSSDYYLRYYMKNDDTSSAGDHVVTVDTYQYSNLTFMRKMGSSTGWNFVTSFYGCGYTYPIGHWGPSLKLSNGAWYRFEYHVDFIDATHVRVHPRVYNAAGTLILSDADFRQSDFGGASWNGRSDWTLASYYAAGHSFCVNPTWVNDFGLGNNGQQGAGDTGQYWYFSGVAIRNDTWPGPVAPR
jgi:hypothetical protein